MRVGHVLSLAHDLRDHDSDERCRLRVAVLVDGIAGVAQGPGPRPAGRNSGTVVRHGAGRGRGQRGAGRPEPRRRGWTDKRGQQLVGVHASHRVEADVDFVDVLRVHAAVRPVRVDHVLDVRARRLQRPVGQCGGHRDVVRRPRAGQSRLLRLARHQTPNDVRLLERRHGRVADHHSTAVENTRERVHQLRPGHGVLHVRVLVLVGNLAVALDIVQRDIPAGRHRYTLHCL